MAVRMPLSDKILITKDELNEYIVSFIEEYKRVTEIELLDYLDDLPFWTSEVIIKAGITKSKVYIFMSYKDGEGIKINIKDASSSSRLNIIMDALEPKVKEVANILKITKCFHNMILEGEDSRFDYAYVKSDVLNLVKKQYDIMSKSKIIKNVKIGVKQIKSNKIFIVHGHDNEMKEAVARTLEKLGLSAIILHEQKNQGNTIIEKFETHSSDVGYAVILLSPDDKGGLTTETYDVFQHRARQNVILEMGFFIGKLGRDCVFLLKKGEIEIPSDYSGVLYTKYDEGGSWRFKLIQELQDCAYDVDANQLTRSE